MPPHNARLVAAASRNPAQGERELAGLDVSRVMPSYEALMDDPPIDAVYIPRPNHMHAKWAIRAADAGKAV